MTGGYCLVNDGFNFNAKTTYAEGYTKKVTPSLKGVTDLSAVLGRSFRGAESVKDRESRFGRSRIGSSFRAAVPVDERESRFGRSRISMENKTLAKSTSSKGSGAQEVRDTNVAQKLEQLISILQGRSPEAVLGR